MDPAYIRQRVRKVRHHGRFMARLHRIPARRWWWGGRVMSFLRRKPSV